MTNSGSADDLTLALADGTRIPLLGLGVWQIPNGNECVEAVRAAFELGYRHIDTAQGYGNEESVGRAYAESGLARDDVYITTKFNPSRRDPVAELEGSLRRLGLDQVDLYLVHWPAGGPTRAWPGMERALEAGLTRSIGVSNFDTEELAAVISSGTVAPVVDQVQFSPFEYREALLTDATGRGIAIEAYSPLGTGRHLDDPTVGRVAKEIGRTPAQVLLRWALQHGLVVLPKSAHRERIAENAELFDFTLGEKEMAELDALDRTGTTTRARERKWW